MYMDLKRPGRKSKNPISLRKHRQELGLDVWSRQANKTNAEDGEVVYNGDSPIEWHDKEAESCDNEKKDGAIALDWAPSRSMVEY